LAVTSVMITPMRRRQSAPAFEIVEWTQHYRLVNGEWYRDAIARRPDGQLRLVSYPGTAAAA
jgi:hypothetical protein